MVIFFYKNSTFDGIWQCAALATTRFPHKLPSFNEPFASLDSANKVRATLFRPTADSGTIGFQDTAGDSRERNSSSTPMLSVQQPVVQLLTSRQSISLMRVEAPLHLMMQQRSMVERGEKGGRCHILLRSTLISSVE
jgi:hypothetical protein